MATGERTWSSAGKETKKQVIALIPKGDYELKLTTSDSRVNKKEEPGKMPYVTTMCQVLGTENAQGLPKKLLIMLLVSLKPGKDGVVNVERGNGLVALAKSLGVDTPEFNLVQVPDAEGEPIDCIDPKEVTKWLAEHDGKVIKAHIKVEKGSGGYSDSNKVDYFIEA